MTARKLKAYYDNSIDAFIPEFWAKESLMVLIESLVAANLVYRDFENEVAAFGDTVNTRLPHDFVAKRKTNSDSVTVQDVGATNVAVKLNQHIHVSFLIKDGEETLGMQSLIDTYILPAMRANANLVDKILNAQFTQCLRYDVGQLGALNSGTSKVAFLAVRRSFNQRSVPEANRNLILTSNSEAAVLATDLFLQAQQVGDDGTALREASLGRKFGINTFHSVHAPSVLESATTSVTGGAINHAGGYIVGTTSALVVDGITGAWATGAFVNVDGVPYRISAHTEGTGNTIGITLDRPLTNAVLDNAVITYYTPGQVNNVAGYALGWAKDIIYDQTPVPQVGQMISFGNSSITYGTEFSGGPGGTPIYTVMSVDTSAKTILLDRPLEVAISDNDYINYGPGGEYNFAFMKNCIALVTRPLAPPKSGAGAVSSVVSYNGLSMRATIGYLVKEQGHLVTLDLLAGVKVLDSRLGVVLYG